ncbi:hypothetical protein [Bradyrhizobium sp.]|uniref:hypothetical protein n=1 Tax=Bradyrhizobium sp. TaxID=376 RepID=UPI002D3FB147|nr:hypothetical protein [Bradyrhizobium sp.]HZR76243.1 hypothetical protein [Bradyrhizobium sp.]
MSRYATRLDWLHSLAAIIITAAALVCAAAAPAPVAFIPSAAAQDATPHDPAQLEGKRRP